MLCILSFLSESVKSPRSSLIFCHFYIAARSKIPKRNNSGLYPLETALISLFPQFLSAVCCKTGDYTVTGESFSSRRGRTVLTFQRETLFVTSESVPGTCKLIVRQASPLTKVSDET